MLLTRKEVYDWLKVILKDGFYKDREELTISVNKDLTEKDLDSLSCSIVNLLGKSAIPHPRNDTDKKTLMSQFKVNSRYIDVDNETIGINKYGQLAVMNVEALIDDDQVVEALCHNKRFMMKIKKFIDPGKIAMDWVEQYLLDDPLFLRALAKKLETLDEQKAPPVYDNDEDDEEDTPSSDAVLSPGSPDEDTDDALDDDFEIDGDTTGTAHHNWQHPN